MSIQVVRNERGAILITVIVLMAIVTLLGTLALNSATVDIQISGFMRRVATAFGGAEAGTDLAVPVIESTLAEGELAPAAILGASYEPSGSVTAALVTEISGGNNFNPDTAAATPDIVMANLNGVEVRVDIDRMYSYTLPGGAMEFGAGYEGAGQAAAGGGVGVLFRITSEGTR